MSAFDNATLMITGGTGSFGSTVLKHFLDSDLKEIRIFSRDEKKQDDMLSPTILEAAMTKHFIVLYIPQSHLHLCLLSSLRLQDYFCHHFFFV